MPIDKPQKKTAVPGGLWINCVKCNQLIFNKALEENLKICPKCGYYFRPSPQERIALLVDEGTFKESFTEIAPEDPLDFNDSKPYQDRLKETQKKTGQKDAIVTGSGEINGCPTVFAILNFEFMGGSMGSVVGEKFTLAVEQALKMRQPFISLSSSGGARMQESVLSLMQMAKTSAALARLHAEGIPYISVLCDPTTGGVTASFAMLGDVNIAEPKSLIAFAGPRVIEQTIRQQLPQGFQQAEFALSHGMVDLVVERKELKASLSRILAFFNPSA